MTLTTRLIAAHTDAIGEGAKPVFKVYGQLSCMNRYNISSLHMLVLWGK